MTSPRSSFPLLLNKLRSFGEIPGYNLNEEKSELMAINIPDNAIENLCKITYAKWKDNHIRYLGIRFLSKIDDMVTDNIGSLLQQVRHQLVVWTKLRLTWFGRVAVFKMKDLPKFIFVLLHLNLTIPYKHHCLYPS